MTRRLGRLFAVLTWLTVLTLVPVPWDQVAQLRLGLDLRGIASAQPAHQSQHPAQRQ